MSDDQYDYVSPGLRKGVQMKCPNCARLRSELAVKDARIVAFSVALNRLADATRDLEKDNSAKDARIAELETENGTARGLVTLAGFDLDAHKLNVETLKATTGELIACEARAERAEAEAASLRAENEALRKQADITQKGYDHLHNHNQELSQYAERYETELADAHALIASLEKSVTDARDALMTNPITQPEVSFLRNARKAALAILDAALAQAGDAASRITSLEKSVTVLRAENVELREIAGGLSYYADGHGLQEKWATELRSLNQRLGALAKWL